MADGAGIDHRSDDQRMVEQQDAHFERSKLGRLVSGRMASHAPIQSQCVKKEGRAMVSSLRHSRSMTASGGSGSSRNSIGPGTIVRSLWEKFRRDQMR